MMGYGPMTDRDRAFDNDGFFDALDALREKRGLSWRALASDARVSPSTLTRMSQGRRPDVDSFAALLAWSGLDLDDFIVRERTTVEPLDEISVLLRRAPDLSEHSARAIDALIRATYERLREE